MERLHLQDIIQDMEDNFDYKKYLAEGKLLKEDKKYYSDYLEVDQNEYDNLKDRIDTEFDGNMEDFLEEFAIDFLSPNIEKINKYYGRKLSKYDVSELITDFYEADGLKFISSNEKFEFWLDRNREFYLAEGKLLKEVMDEEMEDYVSAMYNSDVDQEAEEGFQSDVWSKAEYASNAYNESSIFLELIDHLKSVGGKDVVEGNPDIHLELLSNGDIKWSADVTLDENLAEEEDFKNPILDKYLEIKKSIDNKTVFDYELSDFINDLDNTERKGLESDLGLERDELYEGVINENEEIVYTLYTTNVEYDNGKTGYMYQLVNSEDGEENEIGFDQLHFVGKGDASDPLLVPGKDFKDYDQYSYQEEEVSAEEAMKIYNELN